MAKWDFKAHRLMAKASSPALTDLRVHTLTNGNLLQNADGGPGGEGATLTVSETSAACGTTHQRDHNAATNIYREGASSFGGSHVRLA